MVLVQSALRRLFAFFEVNECNGDVTPTGRPHYNPREALPCKIGSVLGRI